MVDTVVADNLVGVDRNTLLPMSGTDKLTVDSGAEFNVSNDDRTVVFSAPTNGAEIINNGTLENSDNNGRAIRFQTRVGNSLSLTITNNGAITSEDDAMQIQGAAGVNVGQITVSNAGTITSAEGQAIDFAGGTGAFITSVSNSASILALAHDSIRVGGVGAITNFGVIDGGSGGANTDEADGIQFEANASGTVENFNDAGGFIRGDRHGINAEPGSTITVHNGSDSTNGGTIAGRNGSGVGSDGSATVVNYGTITGGFTAGLDINGPGGGADGISDGDGDGIDVDLEATIDNYGTISGTGAGGHGSDDLPNTSEGIAAGGGTITNRAGATIVGLGLGILIDDSSQGNAPFLTTIVNDGTITGTNLTAIRIISNLNDTVTNNGTITGGNGNAILFGSGNNTLSIRVNSVITGVSDGSTGSDTLDYSAFGVAGVTVNLNTNTATGTGGVTTFENVIGSGGADNITGDGNANRLFGGGAVDTMFGGIGNDLLDGGLGEDLMTGGAGSDTYEISSAGDVVTEAAGLENDAVRSSVVSLNLGNYANVENAQLLGMQEGLSLTGSSGGNTLNAETNIRANVITGLGGNDVLVVGAGDTVVEAAGGGIDVVQSGTISLNLANFANVENAKLTGSLAGLTLTGNAGANTLFAETSSAANVLTGLGGNDNYAVGTGDTVVEAVGGGTDLVLSSTISLDLANFANVEHARLVGSLAGLSLTGNAGANELYADQHSGANVLSGLGGDDTYFVGVGDTIVEAGGGGSDTVVASTFTVDLANYANVENARLTGATAGVNAVGTSGVNNLNGETSSAANVLTGLGNNDTYVVGTGDTIVEAALNGGNDLVVSSTISLSLSAYLNVENALLGGSLGLNLTGSSGAVNNILIGNAGANTLRGGLGRDTLTGNGAGDVFDFNFATETGNNALTRDIITDFIQGSDTVDLSNIDADADFGAVNAFSFIAGAGSVFNGVAGALRFFFEDNAGVANDRTIVEADTDGNLAGDFQIQLTGLINLAAGDFVL